MAITTEEKVHANRLRAAAKIQGYQVVQSTGARAGGYVIINPATSTIVAGDLTQGGMSLDDVEAWLTSDDADVLTAWALTTEENWDLAGAGEAPTTGWVVIGREGMRNPEANIGSCHGYIGYQVHTFDEEAADKLLEANGYRRTSPWLRGRGEGHGCEVAVISRLCTSIARDQDPLMDEALRRYFEEGDGERLDQPGSYGSLWDLDGQWFVVLRNINGVLAVYLVGDGLDLTRLQEWSGELDGPKS